MSILKTWLRLLLGTRDQSVDHEVGGKARVSCFEAWIQAYRQRLDHDRARHQSS